jgi:hypothetical protein
MVSVVLDVSEDVFRLGYGVVDALNLLRERNVAVRHAEGLLIEAPDQTERQFRGERGASGLKTIRKARLGVPWCESSRHGNRFLRHRRASWRAHHGQV